MSLNYASAMEKLYGEDIVKGEIWYEDTGVESDDEEEDDIDAYDSDSDDEY